MNLSGLSRLDVDGVLFVGSGALKNAWEPVYDALGTRIPSREADAANTYLATLVHRMRWLHAVTQRPTVLRAHDLLLEEANAEYIEVTQAIRHEISAQQDRLVLHPEGHNIITRYIVPESYGGSVEVVTTNWDFSCQTLLQEEYGRPGLPPSLDYLHGTCSVGLYLPGEMLEEPWRSSDNLSELGASARHTAQLVRDANIMVVWGLSFTPLDAELAFLVQAGARQRRRPFEEVVIVDPSPSPIVTRLRILLGNQRFVEVRPNDLGPNPTLMIGS